MEDLAEALSVTPETVCSWECARTSPTLEQMTRLAKLYGIPLDAVIRAPRLRKDEPEPEPAEEPKAEAIPEAETVVAEETPEDGQPEEIPEPAPRRRRKQKRVTGWDVLIVGLLLSIMGIALYLLLNPEILPLK